MKKNKRERDEDSMRHGDQYDTQLLWFLMRHMRNRRPQRVRVQTLAHVGPMSIWIRSKQNIIRNGFTVNSRNIRDHAGEMFEQPLLFVSVSHRHAARVENQTLMSPGALQIPLMRRKEVRTTSSACPHERRTITCTLYCPWIDTLAHSNICEPKMFFFFFLVLFGIHTYPQIEFKVEFWIPGFPAVANVQTLTTVLHFQNPEIVWRGVVSALMPINHSEDHNGPYVVFVLDLASE